MARDALALGSLLRMGAVADRFTYLLSNVRLPCISARAALAQPAADPCMRVYL